jgi:hypothetical protein
MPANIEGDEVRSHGGLTFGGILTRDDMRTPLMLEVFSALKEHLLANGVKKLIYKPIPHIYHRTPAEEDLYALFRHGASLVRRDTSSSVGSALRPEYSKGRKWGAKKSHAQEFELARDQCFEEFMTIEKSVLESRYGVQPTHTASEMLKLAARFPENIKLYSARRDRTMLAGVVIYESAWVAHTQYIAATDEGKSVGATDALLDYLLEDVYATKRWFDFGISTEQGGRYLNTGLVQYKESFGGRATTYDWYEMPVEQ